jgi:YHS domain-containing protein
MIRTKDARCICGKQALQGGESLRYLGLVHRFCSPECAREFDSHPWVYDEYVSHRGLRGLPLLRALHPRKAESEKLPNGDDFIAILEGGKVRPSPRRRNG